MEWLLPGYLWYTLAEGARKFRTPLSFFFFFVEREQDINLHVIFFFLRLMLGSCVA